MPALLVAHALGCLMVAAGLLLAAQLWRDRVALASAARAKAPGLARTMRRGGLAGVVLGVLVIGADVSLPYEVTPTRIQQLRALGNGAVEVSFSTCCTGGGTATCDVPAGPWVREAQAIEVRRSSLLGRCTVEPRPVEGACRCS